MFLLFTIFTLIYFITQIPRIPFLVLILQISINISKKYGYVYLVSFIRGLFATIFSAQYLVILIIVYVKYKPGNNPACLTSVSGCSSAKVIRLIIFITFAAYQISKWLKNTIYTTISGVYRLWYFYFRNFPYSAIRGTLKRSLTYSLGALALAAYQQP